MISYHPDTQNIGVERRYASGFRVCPTTQVHRLARGGMRFVWSPVIFRNGYRHQSNFISSCWCALDFDDGEMTLDQAVNNVFADCIRIIGTTKSHRKPKNGVVADRFRVLLMLERTIYSLGEYRATMAHYIDRYGADPACKDGARYFWPCDAIVDIDHEGYKLEVIPEKKWEPREPPKRYRQNGMVRRRTIEALKVPFPHGARNTYCFTIAKDLTDAGYGFDEIYALIVNSPTYGGRADPDLAHEITSCIRSGITSVAEGKAYGRRQGSDEGTQEEEQGGEGDTDRAGLPDRPEDEPRDARAEEMATVPETVPHHLRQVRKGDRA